MPLAVISHINMDWGGPPQFKTCFRFPGAAYLQLRIWLLGRIKQDYSLLNRGNPATLLNDLTKKWQNLVYKKLELFFIWESPAGILWVYRPREDVTYHRFLNVLMITVQTQENRPSVHLCAIVIYWQLQLFIIECSYYSLQRLTDYK